MKRKKPLKTADEEEKKGLRDKNKVCAHMNIMEENLKWSIMAHYLLF